MIMIYDLRLNCNAESITHSGAIVQSAIVNRQSHDRPQPSLAQVQERLDASGHVRCAILVVTPLVLVFYHLVKLGLQFHQLGIFYAIAQAGR